MARRASLHNTQKVIQILEEDGGVVITDFSSAEDVTKVNADAAPYLEAIVDDRLARDEPIGTVRCTRLFGRSTTAREKWLQQPALATIIGHFLRTKSISYNSNDVVETNPILSTSATMDIWPGQEAQKLHRDDFIWHQTHPAATVYQPGRDVGMGVLVAGGETTFANGATLFVPGSHLWGHEKVPTEDLAQPAELKPGEALIFLSSTAHAGGANTTEKSRKVHGFFFCRAYIRPEENHFLWYKEDEVRSWSVSAQKQAGYVNDVPWLGHCEEKNPVDLYRMLK